MKYEKFEVGIDLPDSIDNAVDRYFAESSRGLNPFAPDSINIEADFISPTGVHTKRYGFYFRDYRRDVAQDSFIEVGTDYNYRVRFAPDETGQWLCNLRVYVNMGDIMAPLSDVSLNFTCVSNTSGLDIAKGWLEVGNSNRYLRFHDTQESFFAIGENISSSFQDYDLNPTDSAQHTEWIGQLADSGGNFIRMRMPVYAYGIEHEILGNYASDYLNNGTNKMQNRQMNAWELDNIIKYSKDKNIQIMLTLDAEAMGDTNTYTWHEMGWGQNPYHTQLGLQDQHELFTNDTAFEYFKRRYRYIVSRYGYATNLAIVEFFNEMDLDYHYLDTVQGWGPLSDADVDLWHEKMGTYLITELDYKRILSTSLGNTYATVNLDTTMDVTSVHHYFTDRDVNLGRYNFTKGFLDAYQKPFIFGELGATWQGWQLDLCQDISFHNAIWATSFMGGYGCGLYWWWDFAIHPPGYYSQFRPLSDFMAGVDFDNMGFTAHRYPSTDVESRDEISNPIEAFYLKSADENTIMGWVHNRSYYWYNYPDEWKACRTAYDAAGGQNYVYPTYVDSTGTHINGSYPFPYAMVTAQGDTIATHLVPAEITDTSTTYIHTFYNTLHPITDNFIIPLSTEDLWSYTIDFYNTRTGNIILTQEVNDTLTDTLIVYVPLMNDNNPDYAFKINFSMGEFRNGYIAQNERVLSKTVSELNKNTDIIREDLIIKPNPFKDYLYISLQSGDMIKSAYLIDMTGKIIYSSEIASGILNISVSDIKSGVYTIKCQTQNNQFLVKRLIKL